MTLQLFWQIMQLSISLFPKSLTKRVYPTWLIWHQAFLWAIHYTMWDLETVQCIRVSHLLHLRWSIQAMCIMELCTRLTRLSHHVILTRQLLPKLQSPWQLCQSHQSPRLYTRQVQWHLWLTLPHPPWSILWRLRLQSWVPLGVINRVARVLL